MARRRLFPNPLQNAVLQPLQTAKPSNAYDLWINANGDAVERRVRRSYQLFAGASSKSMQFARPAEGRWPAPPGSRMKERKNPDNPAGVSFSKR
jgi:hypothetical protein